jgi:hypothetical protein
MRVDRWGERTEVGLCTCVARAIRCAVQSALEGLETVFTLDAQYANVPLFQVMVRFRAPTAGTAKLRAGSS